MKKILLYLFLILNLALLGYFWFLGSGQLLSFNHGDIYLALGRLTGLLAVFFILLQIILIGRVKWVEQVFGLDKLSLVHHFLGLAVPVLVVIHPVFLALSYSVFSGLGFWGQMNAFLFKWHDLLPAFLAAFLFVVVALTSIYIVFSKKFKYEVWFYIHLAVYFAILWSFGHQLELGGDFFGQSGFKAYWIGIYVFAFGNLILFRFLRPLYYFFKYQFKVDKIIEEMPGVWSVYITGKNLEKFKFYPGQFAIWRFLDKKNWWQAHPFSFSAVPNGSYLRITIKNLGDFSSKIGEIKSGTKVLLDGPSGIFTARRTNNQKILLIAGGVGITPVRSLLEDLLNLEKDIVLLYGSKTEQEIIFAKELADICGGRGQVCNILSNGSSVWNGETGRVDEEKIKRLAPDYLARDIYVCGPPIMMKSVIQTLKQMGVKKSKIYFEKFSLGS